MTSKPLTIIKALATYFRAKPLRVVFTVLWVAAVYSIIMSGFNPDPYLLNRSVPLPHPYPSDFVTFLLIIMCVQAALAWLIDYFTNSVFKLISMLVVVIGGFYIGGIFAMHAPPPIGDFIIWQLLCIGIILILFLYRNIPLLYKYLHKAITFIYQHLP